MQKTNYVQNNESTSAIEDGKGGRMGKVLFFIILQECYQQRRQTPVSNRGVAATSMTAAGAALATS